MSNVERHNPNSSSSDNAEDDYGRLGERRTRRMRMIAWVTIVALILLGGGSTVLSLLFG